MIDLQEANQVMIRLASCEITLQLRTILEFFENVLQQAKSNTKWCAPRHANLALQTTVDRVISFLHDFLAIEFPETDDPVLIRLISDVRLLERQFLPLYHEAFEVNHG